MVKTYKGCFAAVFIFIDFLVLLLCYSITQAPVLYYILAVVILLSSIFYIVYKLRPDHRIYHEPAYPESEYIQTFRYQ